MEEPGGLFTAVTMPQVGKAVCLNIYKAVEGRSPDEFFRTFVDLLMTHFDLPESYRQAVVSEDPDQWRQTLLKNKTPSMDKSDIMTVSNVALSDGTVSEKGCRVFILSPMMEVDRIYNFPGSGEGGNANDVVGEDDDIFKFFEGLENSNAPEKKKAKTEGGGNNASMRVKVSNVGGRFPGLNEANLIYANFVLALNEVGRRIIQIDRKIAKYGKQSVMEAFVTYHTFIAKADQYGGRHTQSLDEIIQSLSGGNDTFHNCGVKIGVKPWVVKDSIFVSDITRKLDHTDVFNASRYEKSSLEELNKFNSVHPCFVSSYSYIGYLYEHLNSDKSANCGLTFESAALVYWYDRESKKVMNYQRINGNPFGEAQAANVSVATPVWNQSRKKMRPMRDQYGNIMK